MIKKLTFRRYFPMKNPNRIGVKCAKTKKKLQINLQFSNEWSDFLMKTKNWAKVRSKMIKNRFRYNKSGLF